MTTTSGKVVRVSLDGVGAYDFHLDWTARVAERCRRELGCTPEALMRELTGAAEGREPSLDTVAKLFAFVAWAEGDSTVTYDNLLDTIKASSKFSSEEVGDDGSPEA